MKLKSISLILISSFWLSSCGDESDSGKDNFDRSRILSNVSASIIVPSYEDFQLKAIALNDGITAFVADPTTQTLSVVREEWVAAKLSWMRAEIFNFGPVDQLSLETSIDLWPTSEAGIESAIGNYDGSATYLDQVGSNKKGLPAIEYLLFHEDEASILTAFESDEKRRVYIGLLASALKDGTDDILSAWENSYASVFVANTGNDANASITLLANEMIVLVEKIKNFKVATPLGLLTMSDPLPDQVESLYAHQSLECIDENFDIIEEVFTGGSGTGFDDYLDELNIDDENGKPLSGIIKEQLQKCRASREAITLPLEEAVVEQDSAVEQLFIDLQTLTVYMKTDMMSRLGLLVTFSDNDGD